MGFAEANGRDFSWPGFTEGFISWKNENEKKLQSGLKKPSLSRSTIDHLRQLVNQWQKMAGQPRPAHPYPSRKAHRIRDAGTPSPSIVRGLHAAPSAAASQVAYYSGRTKKQRSGIPLAHGTRVINHTHHTLPLHERRNPIYGFLPTVRLLRRLQGARGGLECPLADARRGPGQPKPRSDLLEGRDWFLAAFFFFTRGRGAAQGARSWCRRTQ